MDGVSGRRRANTAGARFGLESSDAVILLSDDPSTKALSEGFLAGASFFILQAHRQNRLLGLARAMQGAVEHEKRRFRRIALQSEVGLVGADHEEIRAETINLSLDGMLVQPQRSIPGSLVQVTLHLIPGLGPIVGFGSVIRTLPRNRMGIDLRRLAMADSERLQEFFCH